MSTVKLQQPPTIRDIDFAYLARHYSSLFLRRSGILLISAVILTGLTGYVYLKKFVVNPVLPASVIIGFENPIEVSTVRDVGSAGDGRMALIKSRNFLQDIVQQLSLRLSMKGASRDDVFDSVFVDSSAPSGGYRLTIDQNHADAFALTFLSGTFGLQRTVVATGSLAESRLIHTPGMTLRFAPSFVAHPHATRFNVAPLRDAVEDLYNSIEVQGMGARRGESNLVLTIKGRDYALITLCANTIADIFVEKNLTFRKRKAHSTLGVLEKQLATTRKELSDAEDALQAFRSVNPAVGLTENARQTLSNLTQMEKGSYDVQSALQEGRSIQDRANAAPPADRAFATSMTIAFLASKGDNAADVFKTEFAQLLNEKASLENTYAPDHPIRLENERKLSSLENNVQSSLATFIQNLAVLAKQRGDNVNSLTTALRSLPSKEMQLAELQRRQQVNAEIYSTILNRYNQAKISDAVEVADVYVMDYAVVPLPPSANPISILGLCILFGLGLPVAIILFFDFIDKTVRTESELTRLTSKIVLASIPVIKIPRKRKEHPASAGSAAQHPDLEMHHLVADGPERTYVTEIFRSLRIKVLLRLKGAADRSVAVTSMERGAGKSTVSANLAIALAQSNLKTVLIDGDLRCGSLHERFSLKKSPGLADYILDHEPDAHLAQQTAIPNLFLISLGHEVSNPLDILTSPRFQSLKSRLLQSADVIILDTPPLGAVADAVAVSEFFSSYIVVVKAGSTNVSDLTKKIAEYPALESKMLGLVLNHASIDTMLTYYRDSKYYMASQTNPVVQKTPAVPAVATNTEATRNETQPALKV